MEQLAQLYKALSEETRIRIMLLLMRGELCVCDIQAVLMSPSRKYPATSLTSSTPGC